MNHVFTKKVEIMFFFSNSENSQKAKCNLIIFEYEVFTLKYKFEKLNFKSKVYSELKIVLDGTLYFNFVSYIA